MGAFRTRWIPPLVLSLLLVPLTVVLPQAATPDEKLIAAADVLLPVVARLRGLQVKTPILKGVKTRDEISRFLREQTERQGAKTDLKNEGIVLRQLGLIPADLDYVSFMINLLIEQIGGYYDPEKKAFYIAGWLPLDDQKPAMVHELTHALQDQYFDLDGMMKKDRDARNDDMALAHRSLAEGDATVVMLDYLLEPGGKSVQDLPDLAFIMQAQLAVMNSQFVTLQKAPEYVREMLVFPYSYGSSFIQRARAGGQPWSAVDKIYSDLPASTEQILHPQKYFGERDLPQGVKVEDPIPVLGKGWRITYTNVLGEFSLYLLLKLALTEDEAKKASMGWGGDQIVLAEEEGAEHFAVFAETLWDDQESADRFYLALSRWLPLRYPKAKKTGETENGFGLVSAGEYRSVRRQGVKVRLIVGLPQGLGSKFPN